MKMKITDLLDLYQERCGLYEAWADLRVSEGNGSMEDTVAEVLQILDFDSERNMTKK